MAQAAETGVASWAAVDAGRASSLLLRTAALRGLVDELAGSRDGTVRLRALSLIVSVAAKGSPGVVAAVKQCGAQPQLTHGGPL